MIKKHLFTLAMIGAVAFSQVAPMAAFSPVLAAKLTEEEQAAIKVASETSVSKDQANAADMVKMDSDKATATVLTGSGLFINGGKVKSGSTVIDNTKEVYFQVPEALQLGSSEKEMTLVAGVTKNTCSAITIEKGKIAQVKAADYQTSLASAASVKNNIVKVKAGKLTETESTGATVRVWVAKINKKQKVFVHSAGIVTANQVVAYKDIPVGVAPKTLEITDRYLASTAAKGKDDDNVSYNYIAKKAAVPVTGSIDVFVKPTVDKKTNLSNLTFLVEEAEKNGKGAVTTTLETPSEYKYDIHGDSAATGNKIGNVKVTFTCLQNGKKASFTAQVGNPTTSIAIDQASVKTGTNIISNTATADGKTINVACNVKKSDKKNVIGYKLVPSTLSGEATTDKPKVYQVKSDYNPAEDTNFTNKGKPASDKLDKSTATKAALKTTRGETTMNVTVAKNQAEGETPTFLIVYNNKEGYALVKYALTVTD